MGQNDKQPRYRRILVKLSGEALLGMRLRRRSAMLKRIAAEIRDVTQAGVQIAVVIGAGISFVGLA